MALNIGRFGSRSHSSSLTGFADEGVKPVTAMGSHAGLQALRDRRRISGGSNLSAMSQMALYKKRTSSLLSILSPGGDERSGSKEGNLRLSRQLRTLPDVEEQPHQSLLHDQTRHDRLSALQYHRTTSSNQFQSGLWESHEGEDGERAHRRTTVRRTTGDMFALVQQGLDLEPESEFVRGILATIVVMDLLFFGLEIDSGYNLWLSLLGHAFSVFYASEFCWRLARRRDDLEAVMEGKHLKPMAQLGLQSFIVASGLCDLLAAIFRCGPLRCFFRYVRLLRVARIFVLSAVLARFGMALIAMMRKITWPFCVMALTCYVTAVVVRVYVDDEQLPDPHGIYQETFGTMFRLFQVVTMDNWYAVIYGLAKHCWVWSVFFIMFIAFTSWVMISIVTATVCDQIMKNTQMQDQAEHDFVEALHKDFASFLREAFLAADSDGNGNMDKEEFMALIMEPVVFEKMEELGVTISREELENTFDMLDVDESGELSIEEFTSGLSQMQRNLGIKQVLALNYAIQHLFKKISKTLDASKAQRQQEFREVEAKMNKLIKAAEVHRSLEAYLDAFAAQVHNLSDCTGSVVEM